MKSPYKITIHKQKTDRQRKEANDRYIRNALRGAAHPWTLDKCKERMAASEDKLSIFLKHIGNIFPLIIDLTVSGLSMTEIERQIGMKEAQLSTWLRRRGKLMKEISRARELRGSVGVGWDNEPPCPESNRVIEN